jgi:hypothetical protein
MTFNLLAQLQPSHWFIAALLVAIGTVLYRSQRTARQSLRPNAAPRTAQPANPHADSRQWEVEMHELARDLSARIDSKLAVLEQLIRAAHHETLRLETAIAEAGRMAGVETAPELRAVEFQPASNQARRLEEQTRRPQAARSNAAGSTDRPYDRIYALADRGCHVQQIAEQVACPVGEVELILGLRSST